VEWTSDIAVPFNRFVADQRWPPKFRNRGNSCCHGMSPERDNSQARQKVPKLKKMLDDRRPSRAVAVSAMDTNDTRMRI
jgi:hypothetical protein